MEPINKDSFLALIAKLNTLKKTRVQNPSLFSSLLNIWQSDLTGLYQESFGISRPVTLSVDVKTKSLVFSGNIDEPDELRRTRRFGCD